MLTILTSYNYRCSSKLVLNVRNLFPVLPLMLALGRAQGINYNIITILYTIKSGSILSDHLPLSFLLGISHVSAPRLLSTPSSSQLHSHLNQSKVSSSEVENFIA